MYTFFCSNDFCECCYECCEWINIGKTLFIKFSYARTSSYLYGICSSSTLRRQHMISTHCTGPAYFIVWYISGSIQLHGCIYIHLRLFWCDKLFDLVELGEGPRSPLNLVGGGGGGGVVDCVFVAKAICGFSADSAYCTMWCLWWYVTARWHTSMYTW